MTLWTALGSALQPVLGLLDRCIPSAPMQPVQLPNRMNPRPPTPKDRIEEILAGLDARKTAWTQTPCHERRRLLRSCMNSLMQIEEELARVSTEAKGSYGTGIGEERAALLPILFGLAEYTAAMAAEGCPAPLGLRQRPEGQWVATVMPAGPMGLLLPGFRGEVWIEPGRPASQGAVYRRKAAGEGLQRGGVALVLGAGNQVPVVALDVLHKLIADDEVVVVKSNPVNDYIGPLLRKVFAPLVEAGVLEFVYGASDVGQLLTHHPLVTSIHLTGSLDTYNAIVWGPGGPGTGKHVTAELGNITPYIIVPGGHWTPDDITYHASSLATALAHNAGHNCIGLEVILTDREWPLRDAFMSALKARLAALPPRQPWYPGAREKYNKFLARYPTAERLGSLPGWEAGAADGPLPWLLAEVGSTDGEVVSGETWCGVCQEISLSGCGGDPARFMPAAAHAANTRLAGSLAAGVIAHPAVPTADPSAWDAFLSSLRYGSISINVPLQFAFAQTSLSWGAFPGHTPHDIGSGVGAVHNTLLFDHPQKSVLYGPWRYHPRPFWLMDNGALGENVLLPAMMRFVVAAADGNLPLALGWVCVVAMAALRG